MTVCRGFESRMLSIYFFLERRSEMFKGGVIIRLTWMNIILIGGAAFIINKIWSNAKEDKKNDRN